MTFFKRILPTLFVLILVSCTTSFSEKGSIVVTMPSVSESRAICETSDVGERTISYFTVELTSGDQLINKLPIVLPGNNAEFTSLKEGDYTVTVTAVMVVQNADGTQTEIPLYQGSDTKFVKAGYAATEFAIKLVKCPETEKPEVSYPFYAPTLQETHFYSIITSTESETLSFKDAFASLGENQYYQLALSRDSDAEHSFPAFTINVVTKKTGQETEVSALKENLYVYFANYLMVVCFSETEEEEVPYVLLTEYGTNLYKNNYEKFVEYIDDPEYLDFFYPTYAIQLCQYMPQIYTVLWNTYKDAETIPFLNELSSDELINLGIAKINFTSATNSLFIKDFYYIYAMAGETVTIPSISKVTSFGYWNYDLSKFAYFTDKDGTKKLENSSITVSAGVTNLYVGMIGQEDDDKKDDKKDDSDSGYTVDTTDSKANIAGTYFKNEGKTISFSNTTNYYDGNPNRYRVNIDIKDLLAEYKVKSGDTVVFTISGIPDQPLPNIYWQFMDSTRTNDKVYEDKYNSYSIIDGCFKANEKFSLAMPMNSITIPSDANYDTLQLFYDAHDNNSGKDYPQMSISNFELSFRFYDSSKKAYELVKTVSGDKKYNEFSVQLRPYNLIHDTSNPDMIFSISGDCSCDMVFSVVTLWYQDYDNYRGEYKEETSFTLSKGENKDVRLPMSEYNNGDYRDICSLDGFFLQFKIETDDFSTPVTLFDFDIELAQ